MSFWKKILKTKQRNVLHRSYVREDPMEASLFQMQSAMVLKSLYCNRVKGQLAAQKKGVGWKDEKSEANG